MAHRMLIRGGDGELRLGIRRAVQTKTGATLYPPISPQFKANSLVSVLNAISTGSSFDICYNARARSSEIIAPYHKFSKSLLHTFSCGMRFKVHFETEESSETRHGGVIVGVSDADPTRWPRSKWKCLLVRWDDLEVNRLDRISPWEIELTSSVSRPNSFVLPGTKRNRIDSSATKNDPSLPGDGDNVSEFRELIPRLFQKVLQGQEVFAVGPHTPDLMTCYPGSDRSSFHAGVPNSLGQTFQFHNKVLQGQEIVRRLVDTRPALNPFVSSRAPLQFTSLHKLGPTGPTTHDPFCVSQEILSNPAHTTVIHRPPSTQPFFRENHPSFPSMCKTSYRLFGFPLIEGKSMEGMSENQNSHESNTFIYTEEQSKALPAIVPSGGTRI